MHTRHTLHTVNQFTARRYVPYTDCVSPRSNLKLDCVFLFCFSVFLESDMKAQRKAFEGSIKSYVGNDPLLPWLAYIKWTKEAYLNAANSTQSFLLPLLEKCTRTIFQMILKKDKEDREKRKHPSEQAAAATNSTDAEMLDYRNDMRYLEVWLDYADYVDDPLEIFSFMRHNRICITFALFWVRYSLCVEKYVNGNNIHQEGTFFDSLQNLLHPTASDVSSQSVKNKNLDLAQKAKEILEYGLVMNAQPTKTIKIALEG